MAFLSNYSYHEQESFYGLNDYSGKQSNFNGNLIFSSIIGNSNHNYDAGISMMYDDYDEKLNDTTLLREEIVPGGFFEYPPGAKP